MVLILEEIFIYSYTFHASKLDLCKVHIVKFITQYLTIKLNDQKY